MNISSDIRGSIHKKIKTSKGQSIQVNDISYNIRPEHHNNYTDLIKIDKYQVNCNQLFKSTFHHLETQINKSSSFQGIRLGKPHISFLYQRDWIDSFDLIVDFFCRIEDTSQFFFFEAEINTNAKSFSENISHRIYFISCYKFIDDYTNPANLIGVANTALNSINPKGYSIISILCAKYIYIKELNNPESFTLIATVKDNQKNQHKVLLAYTIEEDTHEVQIGFFEILDEFKDNKGKSDNAGFIEKPIIEEGKSSANHIPVKDKNDLDFFNIAGENSYEILLPHLFSSSTHMKQVINFLSSEKILEEVNNGKRLENLLAGVSLKRDSDVVYLITDFFLDSNENAHNISQVYLEIRKNKSNNDDLVFHLIKVEKNFMKEIDNKSKYSPTVNDVQKAIECLITIKNDFTFLKDSKVLDLTKIYYLYNDNLVFPEHYAVSFSLISKEIELKNGFISYCLHDFDRSFIPICYYELDKDGRCYEIGSVKSIINGSKFIVDMKIISEERKCEKYSLIHIPPRLNYQINEIIKGYIDLVKSSITSYNNQITFINEFVPLVSYSQLKQFDDNSLDLISYVPMMLYERIIVISEITVSLKDLYSFEKEESQLKTIRSFALKDVKELEYPEYGYLHSLLCINSVSNLSSGIEILSVKKSDYKEKEMYFKEIYYVEFKTILNPIMYSFIYGVSYTKETVIIKGIQILQNNLALYINN